MKRCAVCVMPDTRPDVPFTDGVCQACLTYQRRPQVDWEARKEQLVRLLDRFHGECIVPSSGGKDSTAQVLTLLEMGAHVTVVTARTCHLTTIGRANIDNLARYARTIEVVPNMAVRAKLNKLGLSLVGDVSWGEHVSIFTTPFRVASDMGIPLIFYGENPQNQYGGPHGSEEAMQLTRRWRSEFGGFLGLRPADMVGKLGITSRDMEDYEYPGDLAYDMEAHFLGQYMPWDSHANADKSIAHGLQCASPTRANWWTWENLDNAQTGLHDYFMYRKYGFGRGCAQISVDVRSGRVARHYALDWVRERDGIFPHWYMDVCVDEVLERIGMSEKELWGLANQFTNWSLFEAKNGALYLKEEC